MHPGVRLGTFGLAIGIVTYHFRSGEFGLFACPMWVVGFVRRPIPIRPGDPGVRSAHSRAHYGSSG